MIVNVTQYFWLSFPHVPDGAHLGELEHGLVSVVDVLLQEVGELLEAEDPEGAAGGDLAHGGWVEPVLEVAVPGLHEDGAVAHALGEDLLAVVVQVDT